MNALKVRTSCDATKLNSLVQCLYNKDLKNAMKISKQTMILHGQYYCSDDISSLNIILGAINVLIYIFLEECPLANYSSKDECRRLVVDYLTSPHKLSILSSNCLIAFLSVESRFWVVLTMHYAEKWSQWTNFLASTSRQRMYPTNTATKPVSSDSASITTSDSFQDSRSLSTKER